MKVEDTADNAERCSCPGCPTYNDCMRAGYQVLFCSRGETDCEPQPATCICGRCPVWSNHSLEDYYFCIQGAAD